MTPLIRSVLDETGDSSGWAAAGGSQPERMTQLVLDPPLGGRARGAGIDTTTAADTTAARVPARTRARVRLAWLVAWPTLLVVSVYVRFGGTSLVSPDDGFILAESRRILSGQIPHRDFLSPRPAGSALLHCVDFLLPLPLLSASRLVSTIEVVGYTLLFASLAYRKPLRDWTLVQVAAASAAVFVNLHSFPLMAWHTIDGALLVALGVVALRSGLETNRVARASVGLLFLGTALTVKQSFAPALLLGVLMVWEHQRRTGTSPISLRRAVALVAAPIGAYVALITAGGGFGPMVVQLTHARPVYGSSLVKGIWRRGGQGSALMALAALLGLIDARAGRNPAARICARFAARVGLSALVVGVLLVTRTDPADAWGRALLFLLVAVVAWEWIAHRFADRFGLVLIAVGWMVSLSWGYPTPRLVAGSIALLLVDRIWRDVPALSARMGAVLERAARVVAVLVAVAVTFTAIDERALLNARGVSGDRSIGATVPDLRGLRTDLTTSALIRDVAACTRKFPAHWTAVLPGPAIVAPVMHLANPFSVDWVFPLEIRGSEARLVDEARRLDATGHYLVLVVRPDPATAAPDPVLDRMLRELGGTRTPCGNFTAIHSA